MSEDEATFVEQVYHSPRGATEDDFVLPAQNEYDPWAPGLADTPCSPQGQTPAILWDGSVSPLFMSNEQRRVNEADQEREAVPDHPCNYCHQLHWFKGPRATPCPPGTKVPSADRHQAGHNRRGRRQHLPETECSNCGQLHWCSGPNATPCETAFLFEPRQQSRLKRLRDLPRPDRPCRRCGAFHYMTGPLKTSCQKKRKHQDKRTVTFTAETPLYRAKSSPIRDSPVTVKAEELPQTPFRVPWHNQ